MATDTDTTGMDTGMGMATDTDTTGMDTGMGMATDTDTDTDITMGIGVTAIPPGIGTDTATIIIGDVGAAG